jgi:hypothetical protein
MKMHEWKLSQFLKEHGNKFPHYTSLSIEECTAVKRKIAGLVESEEEKPVEILKALDALANETGSDPCSADFSLQPWKHYFGSSVCINWGKFDEIDEMSFDDLSRHFSDIWFPSTDDIEIFDRSFKCFLLVRHWCAVRFVLFD